MSKKNYVTIRFEGRIPEEDFLKHGLFRIKGEVICLKDINNYDPDDENTWQHYKDYDMELDIIPDGSNMPLLYVVPPIKKQNEKS